MSKKQYILVMTSVILFLIVELFLPLILWAANENWTHGFYAYMNLPIIIMSLFQFREMRNYD